MKNRILILLFLISFLLSACGAPAAADAWTVYRAGRGTLVNQAFAPYSFEHPAYWRIEEASNNITFASEEALLRKPPEKMMAGQIIAGLSINVDMPPEEMVQTYTTSLGGKVEFEELVAVRLNGRSAVYQKGVNPETGDVMFALAIDMNTEGETRGLLTARMAEGEFEKWEEILFKLAGSMKVE